MTSLIVSPQNQSTNNPNKIMECDILLPLLLRNSPLFLVANMESAESVSINHSIRPNSAQEKEKKTTTNIYQKA